MSEVMELRGLEVYLGSLPIVRGLDLSIRKGRTFGLAGESGCGKSLTALSMLGLLPQGMRARGQVLFDGRDLLGMPPQELRQVRGRQVSMIFQEPMTSLNPVLRVGYQIEEALTAHMPMPGHEARQRAVELLRAVHIPSPDRRAQEYPHQMSGGMRQRVMIAMAIACNPALLIADEPTTALDVTIQAQILTLLRELQASHNMAMLLITHDLGIIAENAHDVAVMYAGVVVEEAPVDELFARPGHPYTMGLLHSLPRAKGQTLVPIPGTVPRPGAYPPGCSFAPRCVYARDICTKGEPQLVQFQTNEHRVRCVRASEIPWQS